MHDHARGTTMDLDPIMLGSMCAAIIWAWISSKWK